jgi:predicted RNase H-like HicB family nuclease
VKELTIITKTLTAVIHREDEWYVADCPEAGTVSQGHTLEDAVANLREATELYLEETSMEPHAPSVAATSRNVLRQAGVTPKEFLANK